MKALASLAVIALLGVTAVVAADSISWRDVGRSVQIVGRLGVPLGQAAVVEATLVDGRTLATARGDSRISGGRYLRVESVNGHELPEKPVMIFQVVPGPMRPLTSDGREIAEIGTGPSLAEAEPGTRFRLFAFEVGYSRRNPSESAHDAGFQFHQEQAEPDALANENFRLRLQVLDPQAAQPGATDNPDDAQRLREDH
jgi:hypothetical protein